MQHRYRFKLLIASLFILVSACAQKSYSEIQEIFKSHNYEFDQSSMSVMTIDDNTTEHKFIVDYVKMYHRESDDPPTGEVRIIKYNGFVVYNGEKDKLDYELVDEEERTRYLECLSELDINESELINFLKEKWLEKYTIN